MMQLTDKEQEVLDSIEEVGQIATRDLFSLLPHLEEELSDIVRELLTKGCIYLPSAGMYAIDEEVLREGKEMGVLKHPCGKCERLFTYEKARDKHQKKCKGVTIDGQGSTIKTKTGKPVRVSGDNVTVKNFVFEPERKEKAPAPKEESKTDVKFSLDIDTKEVQKALADAQKEIVAVKQQMSAEKLLKESIIKERDAFKAQLEAKAKKRDYPHGLRIKSPSMNYADTDSAKALLVKMTSILAEQGFEFEVVKNID